ncbi:MAG: beta strand repeat-containing protein [Bacteroidota bacterium]
METAEKAIPKQKTRGTTSSSLFTLNKRSNVMKHESVFKRGLSAIVALVLMVGLAMGQNNLVLQGGNISNSGTITVKGNITNTAPSTIGGTVQLKANAAQTIGTGGNGAIDFARLVIPSSAGGTKTFNVSSTISDTIGIWTGADNSSSFVLGSNTLTLQGIINNTGNASAPYSFGTGTVDYDGPDAQSVFGTSGFTYGSLIVSNDGNKTMSGDITVSTAINVSAGNLSIGANTLTVNGTYTVTDSISGGATSNLVLGGTGDITSFIVYGGLSDLTLNRNTYEVTLGLPLTVNDSLTLSNGTLAVNTSTLTLNGVVSAAGSGALISAATGTVSYNKGSDIQVVLAANYGNLTFSNFSKNLPGGTVGVAGTFTPGSSTTHALNSGTFSFNGDAQNIPSFNGTTGYYALVTEGSDGVVKSVTGGDLYANSINNGNSGADSVILDFGTNGIGGTPTITNTSSLIRFGGTGYLVTSGSIAYNGGSDQTIVGGGDYYNLLISGNNVKNIANGISVGTLNSLVVPNGTTLNLNTATSSLFLKGVASLTVEPTGVLVNAGTIEIGE